MTKFAVLFAGLLALTACNTTGANNFDGATNESPVDGIAEPTDGIATDNN